MMHLKGIFDSFAVTRCSVKGDCLQWRSNSNCGSDCDLAVSSSVRKSAFLRLFLCLFAVGLLLGNVAKAQGEVVLSGPSSNATGSYVLSWTGGPSEGNVILYETQGAPAGEAGAYNQESYVATSPHSITGKSNGTYYYRISYADGCTPSPYGCIPNFRWSNAIAVNVELVSAPTGLTAPATNYSGSYSVSWGNTSGAATYQLQERVNGGNWTIVFNGSGTGANFNGKNAGVYDYQVRGCNSGGACGPFSSLVSTEVVSVPQTPTGLTAPSTNDTGSYSVSWNASSGAANYRLEERANGGSWAAVYNGANTIANFSGKGEGTYDYRVQACNSGGGCSAFSSVASTVVDLVVLPGSTDSVNTPSTSSTGQYTVSWGSVEHAEIYELGERKDGNAWQLVYSGAALEYEVIGRANGTYDYRVRGCNTDGCGSYSPVSTTQVSLLNGVVTPPTPSWASENIIPSNEKNNTDKVGTLGGEFRVNESGAATYSVPLELPTGTAGIKPQLSLNYNSQGGNGILGKGWSLGGLSAISRCRQTLHQDGQARAITFTNEDRFCLDGQRLVLVSGTYGSPGSAYKTETDSLVTVTAVGGAAGHPNYFIVAHKDGSTSQYGQSSDASTSRGEQGARQEDGSETNNVIIWAQTNFKDSVGNKIVFDYYDDQDGFRAKAIYYAYDSNDTYHANVQFAYESREDILKAYFGGYTVMNARRLTAVSAFNRNSGGVLVKVKQFDIEYRDTTALNKVSLISTIQDAEPNLSCADANASCTPPTKFLWGEGSPMFDSNIDLSKQVVDPNFDSQLAEVRFADINGDGRDDLITHYTYIFWGTFVETWSYMLATDSGFGELTGLRRTGRPVESENVLSEWRILDYNADGRMDFAYWEDGTYRIQVSEPTSDGWKINYVLTDDPDPAHAEIASEKSAKFFDMNSDGLADLVEGFSPNEISVREMVHDASQGYESNLYYHFSANRKVVAINGFSNPNTETLKLHDGAQALDFNGDGVADIAVELESGNGGPKLLLATVDYDGIQNSYSANVYGRGPYPADGVVEDFNNSDAVVHIFGDINSDGLTDIAYSTFNPDGLLAVHYQLSTGSGFASEQSIVIGTDGRSATNYEQLKRNEHYGFADVNLDGYLDFYWHDYRNNKFYVNFWNPGATAFNPESEVFSTSGNSDHEFTFVNLFGRSAASLVQIAGNTVNVYEDESARGRAHNSVVKITNGLGKTIEVTYENLGPSPSYSRVDSLPGEPSCTRGSTSCTGGYTKEDFYYTLNGPWVLPEGAHSFGKDADRDGEADPVLEYAGPLGIVTRVTTSKPTGQSSSISAPNNSVSYLNTTSEVTYRYHEAKLQAMGRGFLGFARIEKTDEKGVRTITKFRQDFPFTGLPYEVEVRGSPSSGRLFRSGRSDWRLKNWDGVDRFDYDGKHYRVYLHKNSQHSYELIYPYPNDYLNSVNQLFLSIETQRSEPDNFGNTADTWVTTREFNESGLIRQFQKHTRNLFPSSGMEAERGLPLSTEVTSYRDNNADGNYEESEIRKTNFTYFSNGLLREETVEPDDGSLRLITTHNYDLFGNRIRSATNGGGEIRCDVDVVQYDASGRYVDVKYDCLGRKVQDVVERNAHGQPKRVLTYISTSGTDSIETRYSYTDRGFRYFETNATGAFSGSTLGPNDGSCPMGTAYMSKTFGPGASSGSDHSIDARIVGKECFDVLGRPTRAISRAFDGGWVYEDVQYDIAGRLQRKSEPYFAGAPHDDVHWTTPVYDLLDRVIKTWLPDDPNDNEPQRAETSNYHMLTTTTTNALGQSNTVVTNALGEKVEVIDSAEGRITFGYDALGNLITTVNHGTSSDPQNVVISLDYDKLGRKIAMSDPDKGDWSYEYNRFGELTRQTNAKGQYSVMAYDSLGRLIDRQDHLSDGSLEGHAQWTYDTAANGLGQLASVEDPVSGYIKLAEYDNFGRPSKTVTSLGQSGALGDHYEKVTYDQYGRTFQVFDAARNADTYTNNGVEHRYNAYGYQHQLVDAVYASGVTKKVYQTVTAMDARGNVLTETLGNGVTRTLTYDAENGRLTNLLSQKSGGLALQDLDLVWDDIGNLTYKLESGYGTSSTQQRIERESYTYDGLNRLTKTEWYESNTLTKTQSLTYNSLGNITYKSDVGNYLYQKTCGCGPHAVTQAGNTVYQYDANGNMVRDSSGRRIVYTTFDKTYRLTKGDNTVTFAYGPDRSRYLRTDTDASGTQTTLYIGSVEKITKADGSKEWKRYLSGNLMITQQVDAAGTITSEKSHYLLKDHLGSTNLILDGSGNVEQVLGFDPWGDRVETHQNAGSVPWYGFQYHLLLTTRGFTGHEMVDKVGIIHMNGRIYEPTLARFVQADPFIQAVFYTQSYNRYSYVVNNPTRFVDPTGYVLEEVIVSAPAMPPWGMPTITPHIQLIPGGAMSAVSVPLPGSHLPIEEVIVRASAPNKAKYVFPASYLAFGRLGINVNAFSGLGVVDPWVWLATAEVISEDGEKDAHESGCTVPMACAGAAASVSGALFGLAGNFLETGQLGRIGLTSTGKLKYSVTGWPGNQYVKMHSIAEFGKGLTPLAFGIESYGNYISWRSGGSNTVFAVSQTMTTIGLRFPLVGATYTLTPVLGPYVLDAAIQLGPQPSISPPGRYDDLQGAIEYIYSD